jgi:hypothetical protein
MRRAVLAVALALVAVPSVAAQNGKIVVSAGGYDLYARHDDRGRVCLSLLGRSSGTSDGPCERVVTPFHPLQTSTFGRRRVAIGVAVPETVTRVTAGERAFDTVAVEGFSERFALVPRAQPDQLLRLYDAEGTLVGAAVDPHGGVRWGSGKPVFRARDARVTAMRSQDLESTPLVFDRTLPKTCLQVHVGNSGTELCVRDRELGDLHVQVATACAPARSMLYGLVSPRARGVQAVLGSGRTFAVRARPLAAGLGPGRLVAASLPRGEAVRSVRALDARGSVLGRASLGVAPGGLPCPDTDDGFSVGFFAVDSATGPRGKPISPPVVVAEAGGRSLRAADGRGTALCANFAGRRRFDCATPPVDAVFTFADQRGRVVTAVLSKDVASVALELDSGAVIQAETTDGPAYTGRYAGRVRFLAVEVPAGADVRRAFPRDAEGRRIGRIYVNPGTTQRSRRRFAPGLVVERETYGRGHQDACVRPRTPRGEIGSLGLCSFFESLGAQALVAVSCSPRRAVVFGGLPRGVRSVVLQLAGGDRLRPSVRRVRDLGRVWTAVLPLDARLRALRYRGKLGTRPLRVPPASRQCGYEAQAVAYLGAGRRA